MADDLSCAQWRKSSYSGNSGNCVEVALLHGLVAVRDSKDEESPVLLVTTDVWAHFIDGIKRSSPPLDPASLATATSRESTLLARQ